MKRRLIILLLAASVIGALVATAAISRSNISLNESALYPEDI